MDYRTFSPIPVGNSRKPETCNNENGTRGMAIEDGVENW